MSVNKNNTNGDRSAAEDAATNRASDQPVVTPAAEPRDPFVVLDDLAPPAPRQRSLGTGDLKLLRALQSILEKRQADAWIDEMKALISTELEWNET